MENNSRGYVYRSKMQIAYDTLKQRIVTGQMKPGDPVVIGTVARELGMSYIPVREAVQRLEGDGLIVTKPHCSPTVTDFRLEDLKEILEVRAILESQATQMALRSVSEARIAAMERVVNRSCEALQRNKLSTVALLDREFHRLLYEEAGNRYLWELIRDLWNKSDRMLGVFTLVPMRAKESCAEHRQILKAIKQRDNGRAAELVAKQKERTFAALLRFLKDSSRPTLAKGDATVFPAPTSAK